MPPPTGDRSGPGPSAALLPCRSKAQKLRASSSNSLCFLTPGRAKGLIAFGSQWAGPITRRRLCRYFNAVFSYKIHMVKTRWWPPMRKLTPKKVNTSTAKPMMVMMAERLPCHPEVSRPCKRAA